MAAKKITDLTAVTSMTGDDLIVIVDSSGPTTYKMTVADFCNNIPSNTTFSANVTMNLNLTANTATATGNVNFNTANYLNANNIIIKKTNTPANSTVVVSSGGTGHMWSDGSHIYYQANATHTKRVALSTW